MYREAANRGGVIFTVLPATWRELQDHFPKETPIGSSVACGASPIWNQEVGVGVWFSNPDAETIRQRLRRPAPA